MDCCCYHNEMTKREGFDHEIIGSGVREYHCRFLFSARGIWSRVLHDVCMVILLFKWVVISVSVPIHLTIAAITFIKRLFQKKTV